MYSKNFSFSPGFGMPGRAYLSRVPSWENNLTILKPEQFARVAEAKIYGVNTSLCIPINTPIGTMVVAFYSTRNLSRDVLYEKKCIERLWKLKPEPKWKLTIDVGLKTTTDEAQEVPVPQAPVSSPRIGPTKNQAFLIPPSPTATKRSRQVVKPPAASRPTTKMHLQIKASSSAPPKVPYCWNEQSLALLLGKYMPLDREASSNQLTLNPVGNDHDVASNLMSLRLLLLCHSSCRTSDESKMVEVIMGKYQYYVSVNKKEHHIILLIVNDWKQLAAVSSSINEAPAKAPAYNLQPATKRVNFRGTNTGMANSSLVPSSNTFILNALTQHAPQVHQAATPTINQFGESVGLPLDRFGNNNLQNIAQIASSLAEQYSGSQYPFHDQNSVPRVVSEQGPIEHKTADND